MKKILFVFIAVFLFFPLSCSHDDLVINSPDVIYIADENGTLSFIFWFSYTDSKKFSSSVEISSADGHYVWKADCRDFAQGKKTYQTAGRFLIPDADFTEIECTAKINYRDTSRSEKIILKKPEIKKREEVSLFSSTLDGGNDRVKMFENGGDMEKDEKIYLATHSAGTVSAPVLITSKSKSVNIPAETKSVVVLQSSDSDNFFYSKTFSI